MKSLMSRKDRDLIILVMANIAISIVSWVVTFIAERTGGDSLTIVRHLCLHPGWDGFINMPGSLLTYMFTQFSFLHLVFNMLWLFWFGRIFLISATGPQLVTVYVAGGLTGGIAYIIATSAGVGAGAYLCGSSAAVLGVMCAAGVLLSDVRLQFMLLRAVKVKWVALVCVILTLTGSRETPATSIAHLGGIAAGLVSGLLLKYKNGEISVKKINKEDMLRRLRERLPRKERERNPERVAEAVKGRLNDHERLDELLDKIRLSGYNSLSASERRELEALTKRL